jgi:outer membrane usher protein FimD/PapC|tara:strand:- start:4905 stop:5555 length:651 start_codon:yes stop_codon:yes gene_type:complete
MKNKLVSLLALLGLSINVAPVFAGTLSTEYASDFFRRGSLLSTESLQASVSQDLNLAGFNVGVGAFSNQSLDSGSDAYSLKGGVSKSFWDLLSVYGGIEHFEEVSGAATLDVNLELSLDTVLNPSLFIARNTDKTLYTYEVSAGHSLDVKVAELGLNASYGRTEATSSTDVDYYSLGASLSRSISDNASVGAGLDYVDSDVIDNESVVSVGLTINF